MKKVKILDYRENWQAHLCRVCDDSQKEIWLDVMVDGGLPEGTTPESLIGKTVEYEYDYPYISVAIRVRLCEDGGAACG